MKQDEKLRKGICPKCDNELDTDTDYGYCYCNKCDFKMGLRELKLKQKGKTNVCKIG